MRIRNLSALAVLLLVCVGPTLAQEPAVDEKAGLAPVQTTFTCETAERIKFDRNEYLKLNPSDRVLVDAQWQSCERAKTEAAAGDEEQEHVVVIVNPIPSSEHDRLFYGTIKRRQLTEARRACSTAGAAAGVTLTVAGTATGNPTAAEVGSALFQYSDVSCSSLEKELSAGNILAALGPSSIVTHAVATKMTKDLIGNIPLMSKADKKKLKAIVDGALAPPSFSVGGKNVEVAVGPVRGSFKKPRIKIKKPRWL